MLTGKQIRALREFLGLSLTELGYQLGVSAAAVSSWELGSRHPRWEMMTKLNDEILPKAQAKGFRLPKEERQPAVAK